jgi:hypothetical protein
MGRSSGLAFAPMVSRKFRPVTPQPYDFKQNPDASLRMANVWLSA